jgi:DNA-binding PadR family transcriptional regulator
MPIRHGLLAILDEGPCYGFQLRAEFENRTGVVVNVGQVYSTLDRLERDGLTMKGAADAAGHVIHELTDRGRTVVAEWLDAPVVRPRATRDELALKIALALTLPSVDAARIIADQRRATAALLEEQRAERAGSASRQLVVDSLVAMTEAELRWLDACEAALVEAEPYGLDAGEKKRGRPKAPARG